MISLSKHPKGDNKMPNYLAISLDSERLHLFPISKKYAQSMCKEFTPEITEYMWPSSPKTLDEIEQHISTQREKMKNGVEVALAMVEKSNDDFIGYVNLHNADSQTPELGLWVKKSSQGHGFGFEAINQLKQWAEQNLEYDYLKYPVVRHNISSCKLAEKLGGIIEDEYFKKSESGRLLDEVEFRFYK
jgi:RimJ/RimL family protein N-acetyltransferase